MQKIPSDLWGPETTNNPWHMEPAIYAKYVQNQQKGKKIDPYSKTKEVPYQLIPAGELDRARVVSLYEKFPVPNYEISKIEIIYNETFNGNFEGTIKTLAQQHGNSAFKAGWKGEEESKSDKLMREKTDYALKASAKKYQRGNRHVSTVIMAHGTNPNLVASILSTGYRNLAKTDAGYLGKGLYNTSQVEYAWRVYSSGAIVFNWITFFSAYPAIRSDMPKLVNRGNYDNYDAHYALVVPQNEVKHQQGKETAYFPVCEAHPIATYDELVVFNHSQILPRYLVHLTPTGTNLQEMHFKKKNHSLLKAISTVLKKGYIDKSVKEKLSAKKKRIENTGDVDLTKDDEDLLNQIEVLQELSMDSTENKVLIETVWKKISKSASLEIQERRERKAVNIMGRHRSSKGVSKKSVVIVETSYQKAMKFIQKEQYREAFPLLEQSVKSGHPQALFELGNLYRYGLGCEKDFVKALEYFEKAATNGIAEAHDYIGHCYYNGYTYPQNYLKAVEHFLQAAEQDNVSSLEYLGLCYAEGHGVERDQKASQNYYQRAEKVENEKYMESSPIPQLNIQSPQNGLAGVIAGDEKEDAEAQYLLGKYYLSIGEYEKATKLCRASADAGFADAQEYIGHCYFNSLSYDRDPEQAVKYFLKAADQGHINAILYLVQCYTDGVGVDEDKKKAFEWIKKAADLGHQPSKDYVYGKPSS